MPTATGSPGRSSPNAQALVPIESRRERALTVAKAIEDRSTQLMEAMPDGMDGSRFMRTTLTAISRNPDILECTTESIITAVFDAAEAGLPPTGLLNRAWLVPRRNGKTNKKEAHLEIGYQGLADLARNGGEVASIESRAVFEGEEFAVTYGTTPGIHHVPGFGEMLPAKLTHVYAVAVLKDGPPIFEVMTKAQVDAIRARAKSANNGPWVTDYIQMARKTVIRRLANYLPLSVAAQSAIAKDDARSLAPAPAPAASNKPTIKDRVAQRLGHDPGPVSDAPGDEIEGEAREVTSDDAASQQDPAADDDAELDRVADEALGPKKS